MVLIVLYTAVIMMLCYATYHSWFKPVGRSTALAIITRVNWWMFPLGMLTFVLVGLTAWQLSHVPFLDFGWLKLLGGSNQNILLGPGFGVVTDSPGNNPWWSWLILVAPVLVLVNLPRLAFAEEVAFRLANDELSWFARAGKAIMFGLAHMIVGIPLYMAIALSIGGAYFDLVYQFAISKAERTLLKKGEVEASNNDGDDLSPLALIKRADELPRVQAVLVCSAAHVVYNAMLVTILISVMVLLLL